MDIIFHRNCLDGVFSAHLFYLLSKVITSDDMDRLFSILGDKVKNKETSDINQSTQRYEEVVDLTSEVLGTQGNKDKQSQQQLERTVINEQFFHQPEKGVSYCAYSIFAGQFIPLKFPTKNRILLILDTNLVNYQNLVTIGQKYDYVVLIDHHTSFIAVRKDILLYKNKMKKLFYVFSEGCCATQLSHYFLQKYFRFGSRFQDQFMLNLKRMISYISANDRKEMESMQSKSFVLGFYYFGIQLSHLNPLLNKRLGMLNLQYIMEKGTNLYKSHIKQISEEVSKAVICSLQMTGKLKGSKCYLVKPSNSTKISDIGVVLSYMSKMHQMENLAIIYMQKSDEIRISTRSHKSLSNPLALQIAQKFQGGGHLCAAGFKIANNKFKSLFTKTACQKVKLKISPEDVQKILFIQNPDKE